MKLNTLELQVGDIVECYGLRVKLNQAPTIYTDQNGREVRNFAGDVLNAEQAIADGFPTAYLNDDHVWHIQGNDLAMWFVQRDEKLFRVTYITSGMRRRTKTVNEATLRYMQTARHTGMRITSHRAATPAESARGAFTGVINQ